MADNFAELRARRLFSAGVPAELGGGGASHAEMSDVLRALAHGCSSTALALSMHTHQVLIPAWRWRHERAPVEPLLRRIAAEELILVTSGGSDWLSGSGRAERVEGGYRVTAHKVFASGSPAADLFMTMAIFDDPREGPTVLHFAIPFKAAGVRIHDNWRTLGMRATGSHDVTLDGVFVPDAAVSVRRPPGRWSPVWHVVATTALPLIYSVYVGVAEAARDIAVRQAARRADDAETQDLVGEMEVELATARMALRSMVDAANGERMGPEITNQVLIGRALARASGHAHRGRRDGRRAGRRVLPGARPGAPVPRHPGGPLPSRCAAPPSGGTRDASRSVSTSMTDPTAKRRTHAMTRLSVTVVSMSLVLASVLPSSAQDTAARADKIGSVRFPTSCSAAAQGQFEQAVALLHSFWYEEALKAFTTVTRRTRRAPWATGASR